MRVSALAQNIFNSSYRTMTAHVPPCNPYDDLLVNSSAIMTTISELGVECRVHEKDKNGVSSGLLQAVARMHKLFKGITVRCDAFHVRSF